MFYGANPIIFERAKKLRENKTYAEKLLWDELKENKTGVRFKSQHPANSFILDFYCHDLQLAIELDGEIHNFQKEQDQTRTEELNRHGILIVRFTNHQVINNLKDVLSRVSEVIIERRNQVKKNPD